MFVLWFVLYFLMTATMRWYAYLSDKNSYVHALIAIVISAVSIYDILDIFIHNHVIYFSLSHRIPAYLMLFPGLFLFMVTGLSAFFGKKVLRWDTKTISYIRKSHRLLAQFIWLVTLPVFYYGIYNYQLAYGKNI